MVFFHSAVSSQRMPFHHFMIIIPHSDLFRFSSIWSIVTVLSHEVATCQLASGNFWTGSITISHSITAHPLPASSMQFPRDLTHALTPPLPFVHFMYKCSDFFICHLHENFSVNLGESKSTRRLLAWVHVLKTQTTIYSPRGHKEHERCTAVVAWSEACLFHRHLPQYSCWPRNLAFCRWMRHTCGN